MKNAKETHSIIENAKHIAIIQAENPDGDSVGSALALEEILSDTGKTISPIAQLIFQNIFVIFTAGIV